ncbi:MAG TPA: zinc-binding dehydrogenase [Gemmatimonadaceae bacterium]|nr:zinc-binding dehydrogenase [Gemmatimonadaceae bacterium]
MPLAAVFPAPLAPIELRDIPLPKLEQGAALLRTMYSEVCGTDVHLYHGRLGVPFPIIPGHVSVGVVSDMRGPIRDVHGEEIREGDVVTFLDVHETCGACYHCLVTMQPNRCPSRRVYGITYSANEGLLGGWSEAIWLKPGVKMIRLPRSLSPETFIGGGCGLVTALHAIDLTHLRLGESVAVLGVGPVGQSVVALASLSGAGRVIAIGGPKDRLEYAKRMGATEALALDESPEERLAKVRESTGGRGVDVVIEASGAPEAVSQGLDLLRDGGRMVVCGHYTDNGPVEIHPHWQLNRKHVSVQGCWGTRYEHFHRAVELADQFGAIKPWREMVSARYGLSSVATALEQVERRLAIKALIVPNDSSV